MNKIILLLGSGELGNIGGFYAALFGLPFSLLLSYFIFKPTLLLDLFQEIANFGFEGTPLFWGIIYPLLYLFILFITGRNMTLTGNDSTFQTISKLSFLSNVKVITVLVCLFIASKISYGISTSVIPITSLIIFSLIALLFVIFISTIINFIVFFLTVKVIRNKFRTQKNIN
jgi:hypothetical protein